MSTSASRQQDAQSLAIPLGIVSISLFLMSLALPGIVVAGDAWPGIGILLLGLMGVFTGEPANLVWLCNPLLLAAWIGNFQRQPRLALGCSAAALLGGLLLLICKVVVVSEAGGDGYEITAVGVGYWLWLGSMLPIVVASGHALVAAGRSDKA